MGELRRVKEERGKHSERTESGPQWRVETVTRKREKVVFLGNVETTKFEKAESTRKRSGHSYDRTNQCL